MTAQSHTPCLIYDDPRPIHAIWYPGEYGGGYSLDQGPADRIVAYKEHGQGDWVPYYAVYSADGQIIARVPASFVTVVYAKATGEAGQ